MRKLSQREKQRIAVWLDDLRPMPGNFDLHVHTAQEAINILKTNTVEYISLDHDLGLPDESSDPGTGYDVAKFIEESAFDGTLDPLSYNVHSANPIGRERMIQALMNADRFWSSKRDEHSE